MRSGGAGGGRGDLPMNRIVCVRPVVCLRLKLFQCVCACAGYGGDAGRISVPLRSCGCNQTGHWLHDVLKPPPPPTEGAPHCLSPCHVCLAAARRSSPVC